jgi:hypothetical protein
MMFEISMPASIFKPMKDRTEVDCFMLFAENEKEARKEGALSLGMGRLPNGTKCVACSPA